LNKKKRTADENVEFENLTLDIKETLATRIVGGLDRLFGYNTFPKYHRAEGINAVNSTFFKKLGEVGAGAGDAVGSAVGIVTKPFTPAMSTKIIVGGVVLGAAVAFFYFNKKG
jgi:hypothetical protein